MMEMYDDFLITSPKKMESIAREYQKALKKKKSLDNLCNSKINLNENINYINLKDEIGYVYFLLSNLSKNFSVKFLYSKIDSIKAILEIVEHLPKKELKSINLEKNYCLLINICIKKTSSAIIYAFNAMKDMEFKNITELVAIMEDLIRVVPLLSSLFGSCKYRV